MKKRAALIFVIGLIFPLSSFASNICESKHGTMTCGAGSVNDISYTGFVDADGTTVLNYVK